MIATEWRARRWRCDGGCVGEVGTWAQDDAMLRAAASGASTKILLGAKRGSGRVPHAAFVQRPRQDHGDGANTWMGVPSRGLGRQARPPSSGWGTTQKLDSGAGITWSVLPPNSRDAASTTPRMRRAHLSEAADVMEVGLRALMRDHWSGQDGRSRARKMRWLGIGGPSKMGRLDQADGSAAVSRAPKKRSARHLLVASSVHHAQGSGMRLRRWRAPGRKGAVRRNCPICTGMKALAESVRRVLGAEEYGRQDD